MLVASLFALGAGAALLPKILPNSRDGLAALAGLCALSSLAYFFLPWSMPVSEGWPTVLRALLLVGPALFAFGAWAPVLHRALAGDSARRLGGLLAFEAYGALVGLPFVHFSLLPWLGLGRALLVIFGVVVIALVVGYGFVTARRIERSRGALRGRGLALIVAWVPILFAADAAILATPTAFDVRHSRVSFIGWIVVLLVADVLFLVRRQRRQRRAARRGNHPHRNWG